MTRLEKSLFYTFLLLLPFNIKKFIAQPLTLEPLTEFNALFLYLSDILLIALFLLWFLRDKQIQSKFKKTSPLIYVLGVFVLFLLVSLIKAGAPLFGFYMVIKISLAIGLFFYLKNNLGNFKFDKILCLLTASGLIQSLIALGQYLSQSSLGLRYLGESVLGQTIAGVAKIEAQGSKLIRAYGTFPHPNLLAAFLLISLFAVIILVLKNTQEQKRINIVNLLALIIIISGLVLTFSRIAMIIGGMSIILFFVYLYFKHLNFALSRLKINRLFCLIVVSFLVFFLLLNSYLVQRFSFSQEEQAIKLRTFYSKAAYEMIKKSPFLGVGLGNFILKLRELYPELESWQYQPVHNIYLLIANEAGVLGLFVFILFLVFLLRANLLKLKTYNLERFMFCVLSFTFLSIGLFDHFFLTINQGILMFWLVLGILSHKSHDMEHRTWNRILTFN